MKAFQLLSLLLVLAPMVPAQTRWADLTPGQRAARIEAVREARRQRIHAQRIANRQAAKATGRLEARQSRIRDRAFMAVWSRLTPEVRAMYAARDLAERLSRRLVWKTQTRAERIAAATNFIANYQAIKAARQQSDMDEALAAGTGAYPVLPAIDPAQLANTPEALSIAPIPKAEVPDLFAINRQFNWHKPHGQWMNQMLKEIDVARAAGDTEAYQDLTTRYSIWAEKHLRRDDNSIR